MQANFATQLAHALSSERLAAYQQRGNHHSKLKLFSHYTWNMALSESLYPTLQILEITLRNSIHIAISRHFERDDWYNQEGLISFHSEIEALNKARRTLQRQHKPLDPGRIIAELNFGFWTSLLDRRYEQALWPRLLKTAFPHMERRLRTRKTLSRRFHKIRDLRNRIFHHEPIWYWQDLNQQHQDVLEAIYWIEPAAKDLAETIDRFSDIYQNGLNELERKLRNFC